MKNKKEMEAEAASDNNIFGGNEALPEIIVKISRLFDESKGKLRAIASIYIGGQFAIHGFKIIDAQNGLFVANPSTSYVDDSGEIKYDNIFYPLTIDARETLSSAILSQYTITVENQMTANTMPTNELEEFNDFTSETTLAMTNN